MASSSVWRKRFELLCCFLPCWLLRGVGDARLERPAPRLLRCWLKKLTVLRAGAWFCAGEAGPEEPVALDDDATGGGLVDMVQPN